MAGERAWAQGGARPAGNGAPGLVAAAEKKLAIRHMPRLNKVKQPTPQYSTSASRTSTGRPREWGVFEITYLTFPEWMDEVVVTYHLMAERRGADAKKAYSLYQTTVRYADVPKGEHTACVVLPPAALLRYGDQFIGLAVEFTAADGSLLAVQNEVAGTVLPVDWWKKPDVTESKTVVKREGLVDRSKTPFALVNMDDYEVVK
jgi:hypothetical protein